MGRVRRAVLHALIAISFSLTVAAQTSGALIRGRVLNASGAPIGASKVVLSDTTGRQRTLIAGAAGDYRFDNVSGGKYRIDAAADGVSASIGNLVVSPGENVYQDLKLAAASAEPREDISRSEFSAAEFDHLRQQLAEQSKQIERLAALVGELQSRLEANPASGRTVISEPTDSPAATPNSSTRSPAGSGQTGAQNPNKDKRQSTIDALIQPKLAGGQFAGAEGLLKTDRVKLGGYADFRYVTRGLDEGFEIRANVDEANPGQTATTNFKRNTFITPRAVIGLAAAITPKLLFNSEIEFEFAGKEVEVEQAYLEYRFNQKFSLRGGVIAPPLGRFNLFHDSNLQDIVPRPLVSTFVIPSTYKDAGVGVLGAFNIGQRSKVGYEVYLVNGLRSDEGGELAREGGLFESKGNNRFFDNNPQKSVVGRLMFSPALGLELGVSGYRGKHDNQGLYNLSIWAVDWKFAKGGFQVLGEYARASVQRPGEDESEIAARHFLLSLPKGDYRNTFEFLDQNINEALFDKPARSLDGFYVEARYRFRPKWWTSHLEEDASIAPVVRFDQVNLDRQFPGFGFPLNMRRTSVGVSLRPTEAASFNMTYHFDRKPDLFLRLPDGRPFPPYFTNLGIRGFSLGLVWAF